MLMHLALQWSKEYLNHLQSRVKWTEIIKNLKIDDFVFVKEKNLPITMGRIVETFPDRDGRVRVVNVKT